MNDAMKDSVWQTLREKIALQKENAELKRLLRLAVDDLNDDVSCSRCVHEDYCQTRHDYKCVYMWKYTVEAEKLLGGGESNDKS